MIDGLTLTLVETTDKGQLQCSFMVSPEALQDGYALSSIILHAVRDMQAKIKGAKEKESV